MIKCPNCGTENGDGMKFCNECGTPLPQEKKCPNCGAMVPLNLKFCGECGGRMDDEASGGNVNGLSMGDKNVIAGDVVGKKDEYSISGNATIIKNEDESNKVLSCSVCGRHLLNSEAITCSVCGKIVCAEHFDKAKNRCVNCAKENAGNAVQEYNEALKRAYADGRVDFKERNELNVLATKLGLSKAQADSLESKFISPSSDGEELLPNEKLAIEEAEKLFLADNSFSALRKLDPLYERLNSNEKFLSLYLRVLKEQNSAKAETIIASLNADFEATLEVAALINIEKGDVEKAEDVVNKAKRLFPESTITKCIDILCLCKMYAKTKENGILDEIKPIADSLQDSQDPCIQRLVKKARQQAEHPDAIFCKYVEVPDLIKKLSSEGIEKAYIIAEGPGENLLQKIIDALPSRGRFSLDLSAATELDSRVANTFKDVAVYIALPKGLKEISYRQFYHNQILEKVVIPEGVTKIAAEAFVHCKALKSINIPESVTSIGKAAINSCVSLEEISIPGSVKVLPEILFGGCESLKTVNISKGVESFERAVFYECTSLEEVYLPNSLESIAKEAFYGCTSLEEVHFSGSLESMGDAVFKQCTSLKSIKIPEGIISLPDFLFSGCTSLEKVYFPSSLKSINNSGLFKNCTSLKSMVFPEGVKEIKTFLRAHMFEGCKSLEKISYPNSCDDYPIVGVEDGCIALKTVEIPASVEIDDAKSSLPDGINVVYRSDTTNPMQIISNKISGIQSSGIKSDSSGNSNSFGSSKSLGDGNSFQKIKKPMKKLPFPLNILQKILYLDWIIIKYTFLFVWKIMKLFLKPLTPIFPFLKKWI